MQAKLTIDRGNTAIKAAVWGPDGQLVDTLKGDESLPAGDLVLAMEQRVLAGEGHFDAICWCSVVASEHADDTASLEGLSPRVVELTAHTPMPLTIAYRTPDTLGADRLAAALGARHLVGHNRPLLVSDIGTAVTYDYVEGDRYVGGNIAPGIDLRLRAAELAYYHAAAGHKALAVLTGGSAELLVNENILTFDYIHDPYLVHKGLYSIIKDEN